MKRVSIIVALLLVPTYGFAGSLKDRKAQAEVQKDIKGMEEKIKTACGHDVKVSMNFKTPTAAQLAGYSYAGYCRDIISAVTDICGKGKEEKDAVVAGVKSVDCEYDVKAKKLVANLTRGKLSAKFDWGGGIKEPMVEYLMNHL